MSTDASSAPKVDYYGTDHYWNELPAVIAHQARRCPGDPDEWWVDYVKRVYCTPPRKRALVIGCGNGWVEREFADKGLAEHFDAFDVDPVFIELCETDRGDRPIDYFVSDFRTFEPTREYDLIINFAALHHAQYLYHHCSQLAEALTPDGIFVHWDYIGADRNQHSDAHLAYMETVNQSLPKRFRSPHALRPPIQGMIVGDPTEAVHSSEIVRAVQQYFDLIERHDVGGGLAYQILWNNIEGFADPDDTEAADELARLIAIDAAATDDGSVDPMFAFFVAGARTNPGGGVVARFDRHVREPLREALARRTRNLYVGQAARLAYEQHMWDPRRWTAAGRAKRRPTE